MQRSNPAAIVTKVLIVLFLFAAGCARPTQRAEASFVRYVDWAETGVWLKADTHVHTQFSDGGVELADVVRRSYLNGCDVLAITDHAEFHPKATSDEYFDALETARRE